MLELDDSCWMQEPKKQICGKSILKSWTYFFIHTKQMLPAFLVAPSWLPQWAAVSGESPLWWSQPSSAEPPSLYVPVPWKPIKYLNVFVYIVTVLNHKEKGKVKQCNLWLCNLCSRKKTNCAMYLFIQNISNLFAKPLLKRLVHPKM